MRSLALLGCCAAAAAAAGPGAMPPATSRPLPSPSPDRPGSTDTDRIQHIGSPASLAGARSRRRGAAGGDRGRQPAFGGSVRPRAGRRGSNGVGGRTSPGVGGPLGYSDHPTNLPRLEVARTSGHRLSVDKLRVDLMRSELAAKEAEGRAARYEHELNEIKKKYLFAQNALKDRSRATAPRSGGRRVALSPAERKGTAQEQIEAIQRRKAMMRDAETARAEGSDSLPPMAAALFAQAEREERERQRREQGPGPAGGAAGGDAPYLAGLERAVVDLRRENEEAAAAEKDAATGGGRATDGAESFQRALLDRRLNGAREPAPPGGTPILSSEIMDDVHYDASDGRLRDDDRASELRAENESLKRARQALRSKLAHSESLRRAQAVELEKSVSSERVLRGLQSDWTRRLAEARQESDAGAKELARRHKAEREGWSAEVASLERRLNCTAAERDGLEARLEIESTDIRHVTRLLLRLVLDRLRSLVADVVPVSEPRQTGGQLSHRMMSVGGGDTAPPDKREGRPAIERFVQRMAAALRNLRRELARLLDSSRGHRQRADEPPGEEAPLLKLQSKSRLAAPRELFGPRHGGGEDDERGELPQFLQQER